MDIDRRIIIQTDKVPIETVRVTFDGYFNGREIHGIMRELVLQYRKVKNQMRREHSQMLAEDDPETTISVKEI